MRKVSDSGENRDKALYKALRVLSCGLLWEEARRFEVLPADQRLARVAVIRAVGTVFSESGSAIQKSEARAWLRRWLADPSEKVRRYAINALPKLGAGPEAEAALLALWRSNPPPNERKYLELALSKIGGAAALSAMEPGGFQPGTEQKIKAGLARNQSLGAIRSEGVLSNFEEVRIHLRSREGLEDIVREEIESLGAGRFRVEAVRPGWVMVRALGPFSIRDLLQFRCFGWLGFGIGRAANGAQFVESAAQVLVLPQSRQIFDAFTEGPVRYRLEFIDKGHQCGVVRELAARAYELCPEILNDPHLAPWTVAVDSRGLELRPRLSPDPRFAYRRGDVPAASHPPLAACIARLAGRVENEIVWDPFCGSGLELIERSLLGGVQRVIGTDLSPEAVAVAQTNFAAAGLSNVTADFVCSDFRQFASIPCLGKNSVTLIVTNPPMGRRVPIPNLRRLIGDLFSAAASVLKPGGRLIVANPFQMNNPQRGLKLQSRRAVDLGGLRCWLESHVKLKIHIL